MGKEDKETEALILEAQNGNIIAAKQLLANNSHIIFGALPVQLIRDPDALANARTNFLKAVMDWDSKKNCKLGTLAGTYIRNGGLNDLKTRDNSARRIERYRISSHSHQHAEPSAYLRVRLREASEYIADAGLTPREIEALKSELRSWGRKLSSIPSTPNCPL